MTDTDALVKLLEHAAVQLGEACDRLTGRRYDASDRATLDGVIAALASGKATLSMMAATVTAVPMSEQELRRQADEHRDDVDETFEPVALEPKALGQVLSVRLPREDALALRDHATALGVSVSDVIRGAVKDLLRRYRPKAGRP